MIWAVQKALYGALTGSTPLAVLVGSRIYDQPPQTAATFPYIVLGDGTLTPWDTDTEEGGEAVMMVHVWSRDHRGRKVVKDIQDLIKATLHRAEPTVEGLGTVLCEMELADTFLDSDGLTYHGIQRFRLVVEDAAS